MRTVFRRAARHLLESALERGVELNGTFSVTLGSEPSLVATDISVANAPWAEKPEMAHVGHVEVQVALAPLFSGVVLIPRLVIGGVTLDLQVGADGRGNWEPAEDDKDRRAADRADAFYPLIELLSVSDVTVTYGNGKDGTHVDVFVETLQNKVLTEASVLVVTGKGRVDDRPFEPAGPLVAAVSANDSALSGAALSDGFLVATGDDEGMRLQSSPDGVTWIRAPDVEGHRVGRVWLVVHGDRVIVMPYGGGPVLRGPATIEAYLGGPQTLTDPEAPEPRATGDPVSAGG